MKKRNLWRHLASIAIGGAAGVAMARLEIGYVVRCAARDRMLEFWLVSMAGLLGSILLHTVIHELGHLIFGLLTGYRFSSFRVGSLMLMREDGKLVLRRHSVPGTAGQCLMGPPELRDGQMPVVLYNMGGCILNLLGAAVCFWLVVPAPWSGAMEWVLIIAGAMGIVMALANGIPNRKGPVPNDGANAVRLRGDRDAVRAVWIQLEVNRRLTQGQRVGEMPAEWFYMPSDAQMQNIHMAFLAVLQTDRLAAEGRIEEADALMARLIEEENAIAPVHKSLMGLQRLCLELMGENRPEQVAELLTEDAKRLMKAMKHSLPAIRTEYALALLSERDGAKAEKCLRRFEKAARWCAFRTQIEDERKMLELIARRANCIGCW